MAGMKVTLDAAMRARDVSRPHVEHEALADASEPQPAWAREHGQAGGRPGGSAAADTAAPGAGPGGASRGRSSRRRRRRR
jgi:hypothetical protein